MFLFLTGLGFCLVKYQLYNSGRVRLRVQMQCSPGVSTTRLRGRVLSKGPNCGMNGWGVSLSGSGLQVEAVPLQDRQQMLWKMWARHRFDFCLRCKAPLSCNKQCYLESYDGRTCGACNPDPSSVRHLCTGIGRSGIVRSKFAPEQVL